MRKVKELLKRLARGLVRFLLDEETGSGLNNHGVSAIEYGLIAACIGVAVATVAATVGQELVNTFNTVVTALGGGS